MIGKILSVFLLIFLTCGFIGETRTINLMEFYPTKKNIEWKYSITEKEDNYTQTVRMNTGISDNRDIFSVETDGKRKSLLKLFVSGDFVYLEEERINWGPFPFLMTISNSSPIPVFKLSSGIDESWKWSGSVRWFIFKKSIEISFQYLGFEEITTPIGIYNCLKMKTLYKENSQSHELVSWFAGGIGLIKEQSNNYEKILCEIEYFDLE